MTTDVAREAALACRPYLARGQTWIDLNATEPALIAVSIKASEVSGGTITVQGLRTSYNFV